MSKEEEPSLFGSLPENARLHCVIDGVPQKGTLDTVFGRPGEYTRLRCVTYVSSPTILCDVARRFESASFIVGADIPEAVKPLADLFEGGPVKFFDGLSDEMRDRVVAGTLRMRYSDMRRVVHSKIYLMDDQKTGSCRVAVGSANLTKNAFGIGEKEQMEELIVSSDRDVFSAFEARFDELSNMTVRFFPEVCERKWREDREVIAITDAKALSDFLKDQLANSESARLLVNASEEEMAGLARMSEQGSQDLTESDKNLIEIHRVITKKRGHARVLKTPKEIGETWANRIEPRVLRIASEPSPAGISIPMVIQSKSKDGSTGLFRTDDGSASATELARRIVPGEFRPDEVSQMLARLEGFIETYERFSANGDIDDTYLMRIYEAVLFGLTSPLIATEREAKGEADGETQLSNIPIILVVGGRSGSGKTVLLDFIHRLIDYGRPWDSSLCPTQYRDLKARQAFGSDLARYFEMGTRFPLFVDEVTAGFFKNGSSDSTTKSITNKLKSGNYGPILMTTNATDFNPNDGATRRFKYLPMDKAMMIGREAQSSLFAARDAAPFDLAPLFWTLWLKSMDEGRDTFSWSYGMADPLALSRDVMVSLYDRAERELPAYFPDFPQDDSTFETKEKWRQIWGDVTQRHNFVPYDGNKELRVKLEDLSSMISQKFIRKSYVSALPPRVVRSMGDMYVSFDTRAFFDWIGEENPYESMSPLAVLRRWSARRRGELG